ncbi:hypothetical protein FOA43_002293 [Brettanomyces nanus]|uniref:Uncharacterized protein n=1 Tax=Eeniella nana TaxID=13502 RepID=A0A875S705_EENNA|nr:uncharacterized protein FOA43_002293 [Brettanomyces nanus]QPG74954.1 hypothetical protein FOA43_002293 [Brettanomyces nanus]
MKFSTVAAVASTFAVAANADVDAAQATALDALFLDIKSYQEEYVSYLAEASAIDFPTVLIGIYTAMTTYTDDAYTSLFSTVAQSQFYEVASLAENLPWYTSRLEASMSAGIEETAAVVSSQAATTAVASSVAVSNSTVASSSAFENTTEVASSSEAESSAAATSAAASSAASNSTTAASSSSSAGANAVAPVYAGLSLGASLFAYMLL